MTTPLPPIDDVGVHATSATNPARSQCARIGIRPRSATECGDSAAVTASRSSMTEAYTAAKAFKRFRTRGLSIHLRPPPRLWSLAIAAIHAISKIWSGNSTG
jgi:hypothetical protein